MQRSTYQKLVIASLTIPILGMIVEYAAGLLPTELKDFYDSYLLNGAVSTAEVFLGLGLLALVVVGVISYYGLLRFRRWAPRFSLWVAAVAWLLMCFSWPLLMSGFGYATVTLGSALYGVILALPYVSPEIREFFWPRSA